MPPTRAGVLHYELSLPLALVITLITYGRLGRGARFEALVHTQIPFFMASNVQAPC